MNGVGFLPGITVMVSICNINPRVPALGAGGIAVIVWMIRAGFGTC